MAWLGFIGGSSKDEEKLPDIFPIPITQLDFVKIDVQNIYTRILTDVLERTQGISKKNEPLLWDNCLASENKDGLVTLVACAMAEKKELYLVYSPSLLVVRKATTAEQVQIKDAYEIKAEPVKMGSGMIGLYVTFKNYIKSDMVKFYSALEYCAVGGLWKQANISKSVLIKISDLRGSVSLGDSAAAKTQAKAMADGMAEGRDVLMDAKDVIESLKPDTTATDSTLELIAKKQSFYLGMPASYFYGQQSKGLSDTGKADSKATERGLKGYYFSVIKPILEGLFGGSLKFKSEDAEGLDTALKTLETMDRTSEAYLNVENKTLIVNRAFGLDEDEVGDGPEEVDLTSPDPNDPNNIGKQPPGLPPAIPGKTSPPPQPKK